MTETPDPPPSDVPSKPPVRAVPLHEVRAAKRDRRIPVARSKVAGTKAFRRVKSDRIAGLAGLFLVVLAGVLLFTWPQPEEKKPPAFAVEWPLENVDALKETVTIARGNPTLDRPLTFNGTNVTRVTLIINWKDDVGDDPFETDNGTFTLTGPTSANATLEITSFANSTAFANATKSAAIAKVPSIREVPGKTLAEARAALGDRTDRNGTGEWNLRIILSHIGDDFQDTTARGRLGSCPQQSIPQVCTWDPGNDIELRVTYQTYKVQLTPIAR